MTETIQAIFTYARENRIPVYLASPEYETYCKTAERREAALLQLLPENERTQLEKYFDDISYRTSVEMEAAFQAGLSMGLELSRV